MEPQSPHPITTVRRNPPRRAKQTPATNAPNPSTSAAAVAGINPFPLHELFQPEPPKIPPSIPKPSDASENLKVFLRIRPLETRPKPGKNASARPRGKGASPKGGKSKNNICLVVNDSNSVTLSAPPSVFDSKRTKSELYDGFSFVFPTESLQEEIYERVMDPLVMDFMGGKSALLAAMGPTGSGKTHTMFGSPREPGMVPLALRRIFSHAIESGDQHPSRSYYLSMFEIYSERGKGERIFDLSLDGVDLSLQQSTIKGLQEIRISNAAEAESLVARALLKRATAATNANNHSSRSQCIINIRSSLKNIDDENDFSPYSAVLTIADLAGAERERKTGNQGARLLESNFINNTSMVFGLCLRSLLEHQKNPKKSLEKHFKNSLLTRYLRDYLEGKKRMTLVLNVKPGEDDYLDTSFLLRQASPYMKIKFNNLEDFPNVPCQKRNTTSFIRIEHHKRRKFNDYEAPLVDRGKSESDVLGGRQISEKEVSSEKLQDIEPQQISNISLKSLKTVHMGAQLNEELQVELAKMKRNDEVMRNFAKALWSVLKEYKNKLEESENEVGSLKETLGKEINKVMELKKELKELRSCCSCHKHPSLEEFSRLEVDAPFAHCVRWPTISSSNGDNLKKVDAASYDNLAPVLVCQIPEISSVTVNNSEVLGLKGILFDANSTGDTKSAFPLSVDRSSLIVGRQKISAYDAVHSNFPSEDLESQNHQAGKSAISDLYSSMQNHELVGQIAESFPGTEHVHEDLESLKNFGVKISSNLNSIETANEDSNSLVSSSVVNYKTIFSSPEGKCTLSKEDKKIETSDTVDSSNFVEDFSRQNHEYIQQECKSFPGNDHCKLDNLRVREMSCSASSGMNSITGSENSDPLGTSVQSCIMVGDDTSILSSLDGCRTLLEEKVEVSNTVCSMFSVKEDVIRQNHQPLYQWAESFREFKQNPENLEGIEDAARVELSHDASLAEVHSYSLVHPSQSHDLKEDDKGIPLPSARASHMEEIKQPESHMSLVEDVQENDSSHVRNHLKNGKHGPICKPLNAEKPKRRLLPASAMLLKEFSGLDMEVENAKESRGKLTAEGRRRSQGSISLVRLIKSNLQL